MKLHWRAKESSTQFCNDKGKAQDSTPLPRHTDDMTYQLPLVRLDIPVHHHHVHLFHSLKNISHSHHQSNCHLIYCPDVLLVLDNHNTHLPRSKSWNMKESNIILETYINYIATFNNIPKTHICKQLITLGRIQSRSNR